MTCKHGFHQLPLNFGQNMLDLHLTWKLSLFMMKTPSKKLTVANFV